VTHDSLARTVPQADAAIVGGGPAGAVAATVLARHGCRVVLIDKRSGECFRMGEGLPPGARPLLHSLGLLEPFLADSHLPSYGNASAWGSPEIATTDFIFNPYGHGWHLDRRQFDASLLTCARVAGATVLQSTRFASARRRRDGWTLDLRSSGNKFSLEANFVLDCSGRAAVFAKSLGARRVRYDRLVAVCAVLQSEAHSDEDSTTFVESVPDGWWYTALLPDRSRVIAFLTDSDLLDKRFFRSAECWWTALLDTQHIRRICLEYGYALWKGPWVEAANSSRLNHFRGDGWVAAGDAALAFDPLSSQGILASITSGRQAAAIYVRVRQGEGKAPEEYSADLDRIYSEYLKRRVVYYAEEKRWAHRPFWQRRQALPS
jgi:flavin-dependent dehydrogenase